VSWALLDKSAIKKFLADSKNTFGDKFDTLMQKLNFNETNGIVIGPEFSRIFAEIILQKIDVNVKADLACIIHKPTKSVILGLLATAVGPDCDYCERFFLASEVNYSK
jgi:hypothetical protein